MPIDVSLGALPFEERVVERSTLFDAGGGSRIRTCSAMDLVVLKAFAGREQDWLDIRGVVLRQGPALDTDLIVREATPLLTLKEAPEDLDRLQAIMEATR